MEASAATGSRPVRVARRVATLLALALVAGLMALLVWKVMHQESAQGFVNRIAAGDDPAAPGFSLKPLNGGPTVSLASLRGRPVVVNFWASWCAPCKAEAPLLERAYAKWHGKGVAFVGIDANDFAGDAKKFVARHDLSFRMLHDGSGSTLGRWGLTGFPETYFIDARGRAVYHIGLQIKDESEIETGIRKALS